MITKRYKNYIGYGFTEEEALESCKVISIMGNSTNIKGFEDTEERRHELSPWKPKANTLQIRGLGYFTLQNNIIKNDNVKVDVTPSLFEMLYKCFFNRLSMVDISICSNELEDFFKANNVDVPKFSEYDQVLPEDLFMQDPDVISCVMTDSYVIVFLNNKVSIKRLTEELYWSITLDPTKNSYIDMMYYIAYVRGYEGFENIIQGGNLVG